MARPLSPPPPRMCRPVFLLAVVLAGCRSGSEAVDSPNASAHRIQEAEAAKRASQAAPLAVPDQTRPYDPGLLRNDPMKRFSMPPTP